MDPDACDAATHRRNSGTSGVLYIIGEKLSGKGGCSSIVGGTRETIISILFDRQLWSERDASAWWWSNCYKFVREWNSSMWVLRGIDPNRPIPEAYRVSTSAARRWRHRDETVLLPDQIRKARLDQESKTIQRLQNSESEKQRLSLEKAAEEARQAANTDRFVARVAHRTNAKLGGAAGTGAGEVGEGKAGGGGGVGSKKKKGLFSGKGGNVSSPPRQGGKALMLWSEGSNAGAGAVPAGSRPKPDSNSTGSIGNNNNNNNGDGVNSRNSNSSNGSAQ